MSTLRKLQQLKATAEAARSAWREQQAVGGVVTSDEATVARASDGASSAHPQKELRTPRPEDTLQERAKPRPPRLDPNDVLEVRPARGKVLVPKAELPAREGYLPREEQLIFSVKQKAVKELDAGKETSYLKVGLRELSSPRDIQTFGEHLKDLLGFAGSVDLIATALDKGTTCPAPEARDAWSHVLRQLRDNDWTFGDVASGKMTPDEIRAFFKEPWESPHEREWLREYSRCVLVALKHRWVASEDHANAWREAIGGQFPSLEV